MSIDQEALAQRIDGLTKAFAEWTKNGPDAEVRERLEKIEGQLTSISSALGLSSAGTPIPMGGLLVAHQLQQREIDSLKTQLEQVQTTLNGLSSEERVIHHHETAKALGALGWLRENIASTLVTLLLAALVAFLLGERHCGQAAAEPPAQESVEEVEGE